MERLNGKIALITGAAGDIGKAMARKFIAEGATAYLADIAVEHGQRLADELGPSAIFKQLDITREEEWRALIDQIVSQQGRLDTLVNNAGTLETGTIEDTTLSMWRHIQDTNATSTFLGCQAAVRAMKLTGGAIINMASQAAVRPRAVTTAYSASKAAIVNLTKTVALHCAEHGYNIRCNVLLPGAVDTQMIYKNQVEGQTDEEFLRSVKARYPVGRMGTAGEIADGAVFLASDESRFMTGAQLRLDGGGTI